MQAVVRWGLVCSLALLGAACGDNTKVPVAVGGTVSGLEGTGLVLRVNGANDLPVTSNGTFAFTAPLPVNTDYAVTIASQPSSPSQTCMIANGSGRITGEDPITNIAITCQTGVFTVGGTVTGLTGTGLVLRNNGGDDLSVSADGAFTFATPVPSGAAFSVTVQTQPNGPTQTCDVAGASGTVGDGPVTTVVVNCAVDKFTVGGVIAGLDGTVVLQNSAGDDITVSANGDFAFPTTVASGQPYDVTVRTQPTDLSQTCVVTMGAGTVTNANITSVRVDCTTNTFAVNVDVTGLDGAGLVLQNNMTDNLTITTNGTHTFSTEIASGASYAVSVLSQPSGRTQECTVSNGGGTVGGAAITNITVTCVTTAFSVGGTVTGLVGSGLILQDNGGDNHPVGANGTFAFTTPVNSGDTYNVTVFANPAGPTQTCTVTGGTGTVGAGPVSTVVVNCATNTYTVGGTVTGLAGTLVLRNNGVDDRTLTSNGTFAFATPVNSGDNYVVTVRTQPGTPSQTCTVTNGTGTVVASNITSVNVTCVTNQFTIRGTVSGLAGNGLVLQNNNTNNRAITGNGPFAFTAMVTSGNAYAVTVLTNPSGLSQTCTVANGSGVVGGADVTNVLVTCTTNTYPITVNVSGLEGSGLVVRDNGGDDRSVTGNGTFSFATQIPSGGAYAVSVFTNPSGPSQTCVVGNGSGTVTNAAITNVTLTCTTNTYPVRVTVTGLAGMGLTLQNNGGDDLSPTADGTSTFGSEVASGDDYDVTVTAQPTNPSQTCSVSGGTGTVGGGPVTTITVNCETNTYTVGGTVSGLVGTLVLGNTGGDTRTLTGDGGFAFPTPLASGATYDVTVVTQPGAPSQTCTVSNGSGVVTNAAVTNVVVTCTTNTFAIRGTISGLAGGDQVVLRDNNSDTLTRSANGAFVFGTRVPSGGAYNVTVFTNPTAPVSQTCSVTNGAGTVGAADITNVAVTCTTTSFTIGGNVAGLPPGASVVLVDNGTDPRTVSANGAFTFATPIASGATYNVTVGTQPAVGHCTVVNGAGIVGNANVTNVTVTCSLSITKWSEGTMAWPDEACNPDFSFGGCDTNAQDHADAWADKVCKLNGYSSGVWTGNKAPGCNGPISMWCGGNIPCTPIYETDCQDFDQTKIELTCTP